MWGDYALLVLLVGGRSNLNGGKLSTHGTRDVNCSNRFCLNHGVSAELLEPSEKKLNLIDRYFFLFISILTFSEKVDCRQK